jgi:hypothetical protein
VALIAIQDRLRKEAKCRERRRARTVFVGNNLETEMANVAEIKALFFALISGALKKELEISATKLNAQVGNFMVSTIFGT